MKNTHDLLFELMMGPNPPSSLRFIPTTTFQRLTFQQMLLGDPSPAKFISDFLFRAEPSARKSVSDFQKLEGHTLDELTAIGNLARGIMHWCNEIRQALKQTDKSMMIAQASGPMAWLEVLIKILEFKLFVREII